MSKEKCITPVPNYRNNNKECKTSVYIPIDKLRLLDKEQKRRKIKSRSGMIQLLIDMFLVGTK